MPSQETATASTGLPAARTNAQWAFGAIAALGLFSLVLNFIITALGVYPSMNTDPTLWGMNEPGAAGAIGRLLDFFSYFTIWSNIIVVAVMAMLFRNPNRQGSVFPVILLDGLIMITVTGLIYTVVLAGSSHLQGLEYVTNTIEHYLIPPLTVIVFIIFGPRGLLRFRMVFLALIIPLIWAFYALVRGAVIGSYPYGFLNVAAHGMSQVLVNLVGVVILGIIIGTVFWGIDRLRSRTR